MKRQSRNDEREALKVVILAGGFGTRISEESHLRPKPMIEIGGMPILWHIMKIYAHWGYTDFVICAGYKQDIIKEYFDDYFLHSSDVTFDYRGGNRAVEVHGTYAEPWRVTVADTGYSTMTGGRVKRIQQYVGDEPFMLTYGDGVSDVDIDGLTHCHEANDALVTLTGVGLAQTKGILEINEEGRITGFREKKKIDRSVINGGFMVCNPQVFDMISGDDSVFEEEILANLAANGQLACFKHEGFWKCMDTQREREQLEELWASGDAPWKVW